MPEMNVKFLDIINDQGERFLLDNVTSLLMLVNEEFIIINTNEPFRSVFFKEEDEVKHRHLGEVIDCQYSIEDGKDCMVSEFCSFCEFKSDVTAALVDEKASQRKLFTRNFQIEGEMRKKSFQYSVKPISYHSKKYAMIVMEDFTELFMKSELLQDALNDKKEMIGIAAHDLRNPLSSVKSNLHLLITGSNELNAEELRINLQQVLNTMNYSLQLIDDMLDNSTLDSGVLHLKQKKQNYGYFVERMVQYHQSAAKQKHIRLSSEINDYPEVYFDRLKIHQVFDNLIHNALRYSPNDTEIRIRVYVQDGNVITEVHDQGQGIKDEEMDLIFNIYLREKIEGNQNKRSGLGLAIAKKIIRKHRGEINVESKVGNGSVFRFTLPIN
jgi:signal transduction histidine kinase